LVKLLLPKSQKETLDNSWSENPLNKRNYIISYLKISW
jgi:hypothetical protein